MIKDIKEMSNEELDLLMHAINAEKKSRDEIRFGFLVQQACDALNALKSEYPWVSLEFDVTVEEDYGGDIEVNLFDHFDRFTIGKFRKE